MPETFVLDVTALIAIAGVFVAILAAVYARRSADAARTSADIARTALVSTQRAFVFAPKINSLNIIDANTSLVQEIQLVAVWENSGLTPARRLAASFEHRLFASGEKIEIVFDEVPRNAVFFDVAPKGTFKGNFSYVSAADVIRVLKQEARLFVCVACEYSDVFENTQRHKTKYCYEVDVAYDPRVPINPANAETHILRFRAATEHNASD